MGKKVPVCVDEEVRIAVQLSIDRFLEKDEQELEFPSSFTSIERAFIHRLCSQIGLVSKSKGKGTNRHVTVRRKQKNDVSDSATLFGFGQNSTRVLHSLLHRWPVKQKERTELQPRNSKLSLGIPQDYLGFRPDASKTSGRLNNGIPQIPVKRGKSDLDEFRKTLPVSAMSELLVSSIDKNPVVLICGETGSGKTTQIPQYILDSCHARGEPCRVLCTQPRRISAVAMAERVAAERGECVGHTVGYQIRLESRVSPRTLLTFCTNGVVLRTLMAGDSSLSTITHVIVDEVHERDRFSDFLLIKLRQLARSQRSGRTSSPRHPRFRLILMSAALDVDLFVNYFSNCPVINIPGRMYDVKEYYLEDVLKMIGYMESSFQSKKKQRKFAIEQKDAAAATQVAESEVEKEMKNSELDEHERGIKDISLSESSSDCSADTVRRNEAMDEILYIIWQQASVKFNGDLPEEDNSPFPQMFHLIQSENVPVNYRHSETGITALMATAMHGAIEESEKLVSMGANPSLKAANGWTAADMAYQLGHDDLAEILASVIDDGDSNEIENKTLGNAEGTGEQTGQNTMKISEEDRELVSNYHQSFDDEHVDVDLIMKLLTVLCQKNDKDAILVFLPGYDDIVTLRELILSEECNSEIGNIKLFVLHSSMQSSADQRLVFSAPPRGTRKIILSTNIAETSVTIDDVVYVIDAGKVKIKIYEALTSTSTLKSVWISKSSSLQRKGRAGRCKPGVCFHLFSRSRYEALPKFQTAELLRTPLHELCLQAKLLSVPSKKRRSKGDGTSTAEDTKSCDSITDFLSMAPEPPSRMMLDNAVDLLKTIDALDPNEDLTELGHHLVDLPIEPRLGKMVLYSVVLKCLDPVLTIACALAYKDPFMLPQSPDEKRQARSCRIKFAAGAFSDHMCLLRAFQAWQKAKSDGWERAFCEKNYLSSATMQMIIGMRTQLLGQLRAAGFVRARGGSDIRDLNTNSENWAVVKAALCASAYPNILRFNRNRLKLRSRQNKKVRFHRSSVLANSQSGKGSDADALALPTTWTVYDELTTTPGHFSSLATARCCTVVTPACISLFSGPSYLSQMEAIVEPDYESQTNPLDSDSDAEDKQMNRYSTLVVTDWIRLKMEPQLSEMILNLRVKWYSLFLRRIRAPAKPWLPEDDAVLGTIINILSSEDQAHNLLQPSGIGQRPRPMSQEDSRSQRGFTGVRVKTPSKKNSQENISQLKISKPSSQTGMLMKSSSGQLSTSIPLEERSDELSPPLSPQPDLDICGALSPKQNPSTFIRYLAVVCSSKKNIQISQRNGVWLTSASEEKILSSSFQDSMKVLLFVFLQDTRFPEGYARISSPGTLFSNTLESQNLGWEIDSKSTDASLTAYFSVEWITKVSRLVDSPTKRENDIQDDLMTDFSALINRLDVGGLIRRFLQAINHFVFLLNVASKLCNLSVVWELDNAEGERLIGQWDTGPAQPPSLLPGQTQQSLAGLQPQYYGNLHPAYSFPGMQPNNMFNPYMPPPAGSQLYQRMQGPNAYFNPYTYAQPRQFQDPSQRYPQPCTLPSTSSHQSHSYSYLRQNKGMF